jgi:hypothetical protein
MKKQTSSGSLKKAKKLFHSKKFREVIRTLEPEIFKYRESIVFYKLLGISCLYSNDVGGASSYLTRSLQIQKDDIDSILGLAAVSLKKMKTDEAIKHWLSVLEIQPNNLQATRGLELIRKKLEPEALVDFVESAQIANVYPRVRSPIASKVAIAGIVLALLAMSPFFFKAIEGSIPKQSARPGIEQFAIPSGKESLIELKGDFRYILSEDGVRKTFNKAKELFLGYHDNRAIVEINRLLNSNASPQIKNIVQTMKGHTIKPDFSSITDSFPLTQVSIDPFLYNGCYVKWQGRVGSLSVSKSLISFYLWVGSEKDFEGVVPVAIDFPFDLANGLVVDVLGQIQIEKGKISLFGTALHKVLGNLN